MNRDGREPTAVTHTTLSDRIAGMRGTPAIWNHR